MIRRRIGVLIGIFFWLIWRTWWFGWRILLIEMAQSSLFCVLFGKKYAGLKKVRQRQYKRYWLISAMDPFGLIQFRKYRPKIIITIHCNVSQFPSFTNCNVELSNAVVVWVAVIRPNRSNEASVQLGFWVNMSKSFRIKF